MKSFELSERVSPKGERAFKVVLHEIYPDECVVDEVGMICNRNGITWIRSFCERALPTLIDKSITAEFLDAAKTELHGHGDTGLVDGVPVFENAEIIGHFKKAYIENHVKDDGTMGTFAIGEGIIDEFRYKNLCDKLESDLGLGFAPKGSIEIFRKEENDAIVYQYGYKEKGRIPAEFVYSGYALLGVLPADDEAKMLELNAKEESNTMDDKEIKALITSTVQEMNSLYANFACKEKEDELSECKKNFEKQMDDAAEKIKDLEEEIIELKAELDGEKKKCADAEERCAKCKEELDACKKKEKCALDEVNALKASQALNELENAIKDFSEDEKAFAVSEIEAFKANPLEGTVETVTSKIFAGIGKLAKENETKSLNESNAAPKDVINIFGGIDVEPETSEVNIF